MASAIPHVSDLVEESKLATTVRSGITRHVIETSSRDHRHGPRKIRKEQRWQRDAVIGRGTFGVVWKERLVRGESDVDERAVKMIPKRSGKSTAVDYTRELIAIAKFSRSEVGPP